MNIAISAYGTGNYQPQKDFNEQNPGIHKRVKFYTERFKLLQLKQYPWTVAMKGGFTIERRNYISLP